jgi:hypothetical protein
MTVNMKRCPSGHHYDPSKHSSCPYCGVAAIDITATKPAGGAGRFPQTEGEVTLPAGGLPPGEQEGKERDEGVTVGYYRKVIGIDPVVGWLVCTDGPDRGRDYRLHSEKNFVGRSEKMDVCIRGDDAISRENHAVISFNPRNNSFKLQPGEGRGLVYLNGDDIDVPVALKPYDLIELGQTKLMFMPFCGEKFQWEIIEEEKA